MNIKHFIGALLLCAATAASAANHFIRSGATGTACTSWRPNMACPDIPATLVRGDTYYVADGVYGLHTFDTPASGTTNITIKKATQADHGIADGWTSAMGDGQAVFIEWWVKTPYWIFDGATRDSTWWKGDTAHYGFKLQVPATDTAGQALWLNDDAGGKTKHLTFRYIDASGAGRDTGLHDRIVLAQNGGTALTFSNCAFHDNDQAQFLLFGDWTAVQIDHSYFARNTSNDLNHSEAMSLGTIVGLKVFDNVFEDIEGTALVAAANGGNQDKWYFYGNVAYHTTAYKFHNRTPWAPDGSISYGIAAAIEIAYHADYPVPGNASNVLMYNNTFYNVDGLHSGLVVENQNPGDGNQVINNIWHSSVRTDNTGWTTSGYNLYYINADANQTRETNSLFCTTPCDLFVDAANKDFHLKAHTAPGLALGAPYSTDLDGRARAATQWDRGAYQAP